ncbi:ROK family protein [Paenibacillus glycanilyticus]|uniref:ROK family protein n=1 Tax=Paenibacillus glycanilyticus TaxID=126569 RepID=UPI00203D7867|nr:ROK family protein [Paenibacillus glycanilyticus]MCM3628444.1 ROK family protein [Paenibacillus glycanilyticus]
MSSYTHNTIHVKKMNVELVKNALKAQGAGTKASIAGLTKLSVATCGTILNELLAIGEIIELEPDGPNGGRPAKQYKYNANFGCIICLLVRTEGGIHSISYSIVNLLGETVNGTTVQLNHIDKEVIHRLIEQLIQDNDNVQAIGMGIPGVVHLGVIGVCDVPDLAGQPLGPYFEKKYELPVTIENDMNMTVYGFYHLQNFEEDKTFAVVTFPKNHFPGAGFIVDGRILSGNTTFGGEVSYLPFGVSREEQLRQLHTEEGFIRLAVMTLASIIAVINPVAIAITGELPRESQLDDLYSGCLKDIPKEHMPQLIIQNNIQREYMTGLVRATLESLAYRLQVTQKR